MDKKEFSVNRIDIATYQNENPTRVCYSINAKTKERLSEAVNGHSILSASMIVDLAVNMFLNDMESGNLELYVSLLQANK